MVVLYCPCPERHRLWGELWWTEGGHRWIFFDDLEKSETYAEQVEYCPACGRPLKREGLWRVGSVEGMFENRGK
jgi:hypothetical protein